MECHPIVSLRGIGIMVSDEVKDHENEVLATKLHVALRALVGRSKHPREEVVEGSSRR